jgi:hypothetical protein
MKQICLLICVLLCCTNALAQEQKKLRKTVQTTERPLPKPRQAEPNPTLSPATPLFTSPNVQEKPLSIADSIAIANRFWNANDNLNLRLTQPMPTQTTSLSSTPATNYNRTGQLSEWKGLNFYGQSYRETFPAMLVRQGATVGVSRTWDKLSFSAFASANRYRTFHTATQFGLGGSLSYRFSPYVSATAFGSYYSVQPFLSMAAFPYVNSSAYGGYFTLENDRYGVDLGVQRRYDSYRREWIVSPILTPKYHFSKKFTIEVPVGEMVRDVLEKLIFERHNSSPTIMPAVPHTR